MTPARTPVGSGEEPDRLAAERLCQAVRAHVADLLGEEDPEFVRDLIDTFSGSVHDLVAAAKAARESGDLDAVGRVAHQMKGSASNVGLSTVEAVWSRVEQGARAGDTTVLAMPLVEAIEETERSARLLSAA